MGRPRKEQTTVGVVAGTPEKARPRVSVIERRLRDPYGTERGSGPLIRLKDDPAGAQWQLRWVNADMSGRYYTMTNEKGWVPVERAELLAETDIYDLSASTDGLVRRGEKGREILMKMKRADFEAIQRAKVAYREGRLRSPEKAKSDLVEAAGRQVGDQAAEYLQSHVVGDVTLGTERVEEDVPPTAA